jgi:hypothetical protein
MKKFFRTALLALLLFAGENIHAQKNIFIRLYNLNGKKIGKGHLLPGTDSTIDVLRGKKTNTFSLINVGEVKTRRTFGHSVLIGTGVGVGLGTIAIIVSASSENSDNLETSFDAGLIGLGLPYAGAFVGTLVGAVTKRNRFEIKGNADNWKPVKDKLLSK